MIEMGVEQNSVDSSDKVIHFRWPFPNWSFSNNAYFKLSLLGDKTGADELQVDSVSEHVQPGHLLRLGLWPLSFLHSPGSVSITIISDTQPPQLLRQHHQSPEIKQQSMNTQTTKYEPQIVHFQNYSKVMIFPVIKFDIW